MTMNNPFAEPQRIRVTGGPWPERIGLEGVIATQPSGNENIYPWAGRHRSEVIILLDDDPLQRNRKSEYPNGRQWTCAIGAEDVEYL